MALFVHEAFQALEDFCATGSGWARLPLRVVEVYLIKDEAARILGLFLVLEGCGDAEDHNS
jgi:hypothetical protein